MYSKIQNYINEFNIPYSYGTGKISLQEELQQTSCSSEISVNDGFLVPKSYEGVEMFSKEDLKDFNTFLLLSKGLQTVTREGHITSMRIVLNKIKNLNPKHTKLQEHILWMHNNGYSHSHITNTSKAIEYYTEYIGNPLMIAKTKKPERIIKDTLTEGEVNVMIRTTKNMREKAMIILLAYSGVRNKEFCNIKVNDLDFGNSSIKINKGKNNKDRVINMGAICSNILVEYLLIYRRNKDDYLFATLKKNNQYGASDLRKFVKVLAKRGKIEKRVYPHIFRHSLATNLLKRGANLITIKEQLGHSFIDSTMHYLKIFPNRIKSEYEYYIPAYV